MAANHHTLERDDGTPFFYLGDTAWALFQRTSREEADHYLVDRAGKGFTVIQAAVLFDLQPGDARDVYGTSKSIQTYTPPSSGRGNDWILILEDAAARLPALGPPSTPVR